MTHKTLVPCPYCGEMIHPRAAACPHCGSDDRTGWSDETYLDGIELGNDVDYEELRENEFPSGRYPVTWWKSWKTITGAILLGAFLFLMLRLV